MGDGLEHREVGQRSNQAAAHDDDLAANFVRQRSEQHEERCADQQRNRDQDVGGVGVNLQRLRQEEECVELTRVPDHSLASRQAEERQQHDLQVAPFAERLLDRCLGSFAFFLHAFEGGRFVQLQTDPHRNTQQYHRNQERNAPAPGFECFFADAGTHTQNHQQRQEQTQRCRGLNPAGVGAALAVRRVFGHVGRRAAVLAAKRQTLQQAQNDQDGRGGHANRVIAGQHADQEGRKAHDHDGDQEGVLASDQIAETAKHERAERTNREAGSERHQRENERSSRVHAREKVRRDDRRERTIQVKVVPLEYRAQ